MTSDKRVEDLLGFVQWIKEECERSAQDAEGRLAMVGQRCGFVLARLLGKSAPPPQANSLADHEGEAGKVLVNTSTVQVRGNGRGEYVAVVQGQQVRLEAFFLQAQAGEPPVAQLSFLAEEVPGG